MLKNQLTREIVIQITHYYKFDVTICREKLFHGLDHQVYILPANFTVPIYKKKLIKFSHLWIENESDHNGPWSMWFHTLL